MTCRRRGASLPIRRLFATLAVVAASGLALSAQSDLDAFMAQVLARRDENWKKLQQYTLAEDETFSLTGTGGTRMYGFKREYPWFPRDGVFVRSPTRADGLSISEADRRRAEQRWIRQEQERERPRENDNDSLHLDLAFQDFAQELESLSTEYGPPSACFILASQDGTFIGRGGLRQISNSECEMKRLYVVPGHRGEGVGRLVAEALIEQARQLGYQAMLLDTLPAMRGAQGLYTSLGFELTSAYRYNPVAGASYWKLRL